MADVVPPVARRSAPKQELHLHFHGVTADEVAAIIARQNGD